jgi:uncharacterized protein YdhG (YjbR/CyaY superfamily)
MTETNPIDEYIEGFEGEQKKKLIEIRKLIRSLVPEAKEKISYGMPTFDLHGNLVHFAGFAHHIGFYPAPSGIENFESRIAKYKHAKGSVQFPLDEPLPVDLIRDIVEYRKQENEKKQKKTLNAKTDKQ